MASTLPLAFVLVCLQESRPADPVATRIPLRDGKWLAADVWLPAAAGKHPAVLIQTPYDKGRTRIALRRAAGNFAFVDRAHYGYVVVDWRGFYGSKEAGQPERGQGRGKDGFDCVEWVAAQEWCDGKVGTWGGSALGRQQFDTAREQPPHLVCCVPLIAPLGQRYDAYYQGGVLLDSHVQSLDRLGFGIGTLVRAAPQPSAAAWRVAERRTWRPADVKVPMLLVTGWWDHFPDQILETLDDLVQHGGSDATKTHSRLLIGPWDHVSVDEKRQGEMEFPGAAGAAAAAAQSFFDRWLRGITDNGQDQEPRVRWWTVGDTEWHGGERWPPKTEPVRWFLHGDGALQPVAPDATRPKTRELAADPKAPAPTLGGQNLPPAPHGPRDHRALESRADVLTYRTGPLAEPLRIEGAPRVEVTLSCDQVDCDLSARLCVVDQEGRALLVSEGMQRAKLRDPQRTQLLEPGKEFALAVQLAPVSLHVAKGRELRLYLSAANAPRYELNGHDGADHFTAATARAVRLSIRHDPEQPAVLVLPVPARK